MIFQTGTKTWTKKAHLKLPAELAELLEVGVGQLLHVFGLQLGELTALPRVPVTLPVLGDLPHHLDLFQFLQAENLNVREKCKVIVLL